MRLFFSFLLVTLMVDPASAERLELDTVEFRQWGHEEWKAFVLGEPLEGRDFAYAKLDVLLREDRDVVHVAYALGLAEYLLGRHLASNSWYTYALDQPDLRERMGPVWSDEEQALRKESALYNNLGINYEVMQDWVAAEEAYARSREIDVRLGEEDAAWLTAINIGLLRFREHQIEEARSLLREAADHFAERGDAYNEGKALLNLAIAEQDLDPGDLSMEHARQAFERFAVLGDSTEAVRALVTAGQFSHYRGDHEALGEVLLDLERMRPGRLAPQIQYAALILQANRAAYKGDWTAVERFLGEVDSLMLQFPDLPHSDNELELKMAAAFARGDGETSLALFRAHNQGLREQFGNQSAMLLAEVWDINDRAEQMHRNEQLQTRLRFAQRLNWAGGLILLMAFLVAATFIWKRRSDLRSQQVIVRLLRRHLIHRSSRSPETKARTALEDTPSEASRDEPGSSPLLRDLFMALEELVTNEGVHRVSNHSLGYIAGKLNSNTRYVSQAIRQETSLSYSDYMNMLRIQDAQQMMLAEESQGLSLDQIADQCGFGTRRTFYRQFTKFTGMPPGQFLRLSQAERAAVLEQSRP